MSGLTGAGLCSAVVVVLGIILCSGRGPRRAPFSISPLGARVWITKMGERRGRWVRHGLGVQWRGVTRWDGSALHWGGKRK